jgi:integrase
MLAYLKVSEREKRSAERDRFSLKQLYPFFTGRELSGLAALDVRAYIERRQEAGTGNGTINRELGLLSAAINYARKEWDWDVPNPAQGRRLREPEGRVRWLTRAEAVALVRMADSEPQAPHLGDFIRLALHTGMRRGEMLGLEWRRVDLQAGLIHLEAAHTKAGKRRAVPINAVAREAVMDRKRFRAQHCPASPWVFCDKEGGRVQSVKRSFATACRKAGIEDFRIHDLRHTCAAWLVSAGVPLTEVRDLLGHSTVKMTERYAHLAPENVRAAVTLLEGHESRSSHVGNKSRDGSTPKSLIQLVGDTGFEPVTPAV